MVRGRRLRPCGPGVVHGGGEVEEVARVHRGAGEIVADRLQQHFHPAPRHRDALVGERRARQVTGEHGGGAGRHGEGRGRRARIGERAAALGAPVAEAIVTAGRLRPDGGGVALAVAAGAGAACDAQEEAGGTRPIDGEAPVGGDGLEPADPAAGAGPAHLDGPNDPLAAQAEVQRRRRLGEVGAAEADLTDLGAGGRAHRDPCADGARVGVAAREVDREPVVAPFEHVAIDRGRGAVVGDQDVHAAVAVVVGADDAPSLAAVIDAELSGPLGEGAVAVGHEEPRRILEERGDLPLLAGRVLDVFAEPAVGEKQVPVAVVVEVGEAGTPAPPAFANAGGIGRVFEAAVADIAVEPIARGAEAGTAVRIVDAGYEPVHVPVQVVVPHGGAHAVLVGDGGTGDVGEATAFVPQHLARAEVGGQQDVGVAVAVDVGEGRREGEFAPVS